MKEDRTIGLFENKEGLDKLDDEQVEDVAGGYIHYAGGYFGGYSTYEVIHDESGEVLATFDGPDSYAEAKAKAQELGMTTDGLTDAQLRAMRAYYKEGK